MALEAVKSERTCWNPVEDTAVVPAKSCVLQIPDASMIINAINDSSGFTRLPVIPFEYSCACYY